MNRAAWRAVIFVALIMVAASLASSGLAPLQRAMPALHAGQLFTSGVSAISQLPRRIELDQVIVSWLLPAGLVLLAAALAFRRFMRAERGGTLSWAEAPLAPGVATASSRSPAALRREVRRLVAEGLAPGEIARRTGVGQDALRPLLEQR